MCAHACMWWGWVIKTGHTVLAGVASFLPASSAAKCVGQRLYVSLYRVLVSSGVKFKPTLRFAKSLLPAGITPSRLSVPSLPGNLSLNKTGIFQNVLLGRQFLPRCGGTQPSEASLGYMVNPWVREGKPGRRGRRTLPVFCQALSALSRPYFLFSSRSFPPPGATFSHPLSLGNFGNYAMLYPPGPGVATLLPVPCPLLGLIGALNSHRQLAGCCCSITHLARPQPPAPVEKDMPASRRLGRLWVGCPEAPLAYCGNQSSGTNKLLIVTRAKILSPCLQNEGLD